MFDILSSWYVLLMYFFIQFAELVCSLIILLNICTHAILINSISQFSINLSFLHQQIYNIFYFWDKQGSLRYQSKQCCYIVHNVYIDAYITWEYKQISLLKDYFIQHLHLNTFFVDIFMIYFPFIHI